MGTNREPSRQPLEMAEANTIEFDEDIQPPEVCVDASGKNTMVIRCKRCNCRIISAGKCELVEQEENVKDGKGEEEALHWFWRVADVFDYDNIAFTRAGEGATLKYLTCADCEHEALGIMYLAEKWSVLSAKKVKYADPATTGGHRVMRGGENPQLDQLVAQQREADGEGEQNPAAEGSAE